MKTLNGVFTRGKKMTKTPELLPCPFCGGEAEIDSVEHGDGPNRMSQTRIYCSNCYCETDWNTGTYDFKDAIDIWNTRVYPEEVLRALDKQTPDLVMQLCNEWGGTDNMCPKCSAHVSGKFCANCGQRLDWRNEE